jgi:hypothetical protein
MTDEYPSESLDILLGVCGSEEYEVRNFQEFLEDINQEISQAEKALEDLYLERREAILKEFLMTPITHAVENSAKSFMTVPRTDPLSKIFQKVEEGRKSRRKVKVEVARKQARQARDKCFKEIIEEFDLDPNVQHVVVDLPVPTTDQLLEAITEKR